MVESERKQARYLLLAFVFAVISVFSSLIAFVEVSENRAQQELLDCLNRDNEPEWCVEHFG